MSNPSGDDFEQWDERELSRLSSVARLLDGVAPDPLFDSPLPEIEDSPEFTVTRHPARQPVKRETARHG